MNIYFLNCLRFRIVSYVLAIILFSVVGLRADSTVPSVFKAYFKKGVDVSGEVGSVALPEGINQYIKKIREAVNTDPEWYQEYQKKSEPGVVLPWHEKLGLTQEEYSEYVKLWGERRFQVTHQVTLKLEESNSGEWAIRVSGVGMPVNLLRFMAATQSFRSPNSNGELIRIDDVDASAETILGGWEGQEWKYEEVSGSAFKMERIALGKLTNTGKGGAGKRSLLIYRFREKVAGEGLVDRSIVIRFSEAK